VPSENPNGLLVAAVLVGALQSAFLFVIYKSLHRNPLDTIVVSAIASGAIVLLLISLLARNISSNDVYAYVGYGKLGLAQAYEPQAHELPTAYGLVGELWGDPMPPCYYGPLWVLIAQTAMSFAGSVVQGVYIWRAIGLASFIAILILLRAKGLSPDIIALVALNTGFVELFVAEAHNDLLAVALTLAATIAVRKLPLLAAVLIAAAALIKLPFIALGFLAFSSKTTLRRGIGYMTVAVVLTVLGSLAFGGSHYFADLLLRLNHPPPREVPIVAWAKFSMRALFAIALAAVLLAFIWRKYLGNSVSLSFIGLSMLKSHPWYLIWAMPYAWLDEKSLVVYLIAFPLVASLMFTKLATPVLCVTFTLLDLALRTRAKATYLRDLR
jgi:hypothetical protein